MIVKAECRNRLLAALPAEDFQRLRGDLEGVSLPLGRSIYEAGSHIEYLYFPSEGIISLLQVMENGSSGEIAVVGNEGVVGISLFMGGETTPSRAVVQSEARALRLPARKLDAEFKRGGELHNLLLRYTQALITQMSQTAVCNRLHSLEQQLCRWLLLSHDRLQTNNLIMTHEMISTMLGVRREGVSLAAGRLQKAGIINYARGQITIIDRARLETQVCECYKIVKTESDRLLGKD